MQTAAQAERTTRSHPGPVPDGVTAIHPIPTDSGQPTLLAIVAHELGAPLSAMLAGSELLADQPDSLNPEAIREVVGTLHRSTLWLQGLVENLLCAPSINTGHLQLQRRLLWPRALVTEVQPILTPLLHKRDQILRLSARGTLRPVAADGQRIGQVLVNLVSNASKFSVAGGAIDLTLSGRPAGLRITVADRGPGLPRGSPTRLFDPFQRGDPMRSAGPEGIGLGLAIVKAVVESHGGRVGASNRRGGGAAFWFELPQAQEPVPASVRD
jgi:two-component system, OmpR family, sensor histidine kinase KdpD